MNQWLSGWRGIVLGCTVVLLLIGLVFFGRWTKKTPSLSSSNLSGKVAPLEDVGEKTKMAVEQAFQTGLEKSGIEVVSSGELLEFMVDSVMKEVPHCFGKKQEGELRKEIARLKNETAVSGAASSSAGESKPNSDTGGPRIKTPGASPDPPPANPAGVVSGPGGTVS